MRAQNKIPISEYLFFCYLGVQVILEYLYDLEYMGKEIYEQYSDEYKQIGKMLVTMIQEWK